jgi:cystathionine beta-lyase
MIDLFETLIDRRSTNSIKWELFGPEVLPMWVADMDFRAPQAVLDALQAKVSHGIFGYEMPSTALIATVVERMQRLYGWTIKPEDVVVVPGIVSGMNVAARLGAVPGDGVLIQPPVYGPFMGAAKNFGLTVDAAPLTLDIDGQRLRYRFDVEAFERAITPRTKLFMLCHPHNPSGQIYTPAELQAMAAVCAKHDLLIVSDELHSELLLGGAAFTPLAVAAPEVADRTITLVAPSKTFNLPGLGCGFAIIPDARLRAQYVAAADGIVPHNNALGMAAAQAAFSTATDTWLHAARAYLTANRDVAVDFILKTLPQVRTTVPDATYMLWLDMREAGLGSNPFRALLDRAKVATTEGSFFGPGGDGFVRLNFGCPRPTLIQGLEQIRSALTL